MFNIRIKHFYDTEQIQVFSKAMHTAGEITRPPCCPVTGEIYEREEEHLYKRNPFHDDEYEVMYEMREPTDPDLLLRQSASRAKNAVYDIARSNPWEWFVTFTFSPERVDRYSFEDCTKKFHNWLMNMRKVCPDMVYLVVPEKHKDGAFHFHGLFADVTEMDFQYSGHFDGNGRAIYNIGNYKWGWVTATRVTDFRRASAYLCKYITKDLCSVTKGKKRYWHSKNCQLPVIEEFMIDRTDEERLHGILRIVKHTFIKKLETPWTDITYIECEKPRLETKKGME